MSVILAIETATEACSAALFYQDKILSRYCVAPQQHANLILIQCEELLQEAGISPAQLSAIAFGRGPGSFTGVRIATAVAQGMAMAHDLPVIPVSSLHALAQETYLQTGAEKVLAGIDARMKEIYVGYYLLKDGVMQLEDQEVLTSHEKLTRHYEGFRAGSAFQQENILFPSAKAVIYLAQKVEPISPEFALPVYLRDKVTF